MPTERTSDTSETVEAAPEASRTELPACPVDLSIQCPTCGTEMQPEHAHYRCLRCGYRDSCCM